MNIKLNCLKIAESIPRSNVNSHDKSKLNVTFNTSHITDFMPVQHPNARNILNRAKDTEINSFQIEPQTIYLNYVPMDKITREDVSSIICTRRQYNEMLIDEVRSNIETLKFSFNFFTRSIVCLVML